jgi:hypothetical protein
MIENPVIPRLKYPDDRMTELDRIEWQAGLSLESFGILFGVRVNQAALIDAFPPYFPPLSKSAGSSAVHFLYSLIAGPGSTPFYELFFGSKQILRSKDLNQILQYFEQSLEMRIAMGSQKLFVHAGVVGWQGQAILIPGRSMSGKTRMVASLLKSGAVYYSDEFAVLDATGYVHAYPRPLRIRETNTQHDYNLQQVTTFGQQPLPAGLVAMLQYKSDAVWSPRQLSPAELVLAVLDHTIVARYRPAQCLATLKCIASRAIAIASDRNESDEVAQVLLSYL